MISNLGTYQLMTTAAKKVGGPLMLAGLIFAGGFISGVIANAILSKKSDDNYLIIDADNVIDA